jgi:hypothetical protein
MEAPGTFITHQSIMVSFVFSVKKVSHLWMISKVPGVSITFRLLTTNNLQELEANKNLHLHFSSTTINWNKPQNFVRKKPNSHYYFVFMKIIQVEIKMENKKKLLFSTFMWKLRIKLQLFRISL